MDKDQITAIAREYAEEVCAHMKDDFIKDEAIRDNEQSFQSVVEHLSRRFCLVEKEAIRKEYTQAVAEYDPYDSMEAGYNRGKIDVVKSLFPEIAKEVE